MGRLLGFERGLGRVVEGGFARVFRGKVEPVELAQALKREADANRMVGPHRTLIPNQYEVDLSPSDYDRLSPYRLTLGDELAEMVQEHADEQQYATVGPVEVALVRSEHLHTGAYRVGSRVEAETHPRGPEPYPAEPYPAEQQSPERYPPAPAFPPPTAPAPAPAPIAAGYPVSAPIAVPPAVPRDAMTTAVPRVAPAAYGRLELPDGQWTTIGAGALVLGRGHEADVRLADASVSRRHARIGPDSGQVMLEDLGSTNGTTVNGERTARATLRDGDRILLGAAAIVYRA